MNTLSLPFLAVASIIAELSAVMDVAAEISLAAANAKAIAFRAGDKARGFQPITDFINELAKNTIALLNEIDEQALLLYRLTLQEHQLDTTARQFDSAMEQSRSARFHQSLQAPCKTVHDKRLACRQQIHLHLSRLQMQLIDIMHPARAARVIAANSRIEAAQAGEYLTSLQTVAESVEHAANIIHEKVQRSRNMLSTIELDNSL